MRRVISFTALAAVCVLGFATTASADFITWGAGVDLFGGGNTETFVNANGTGVVAINSTSTAALLSATVNGVVFAGSDNVAMAAGVTQNGVTFTTSLPGGSNQGALGFGGFTSGSEAANLLAGQVFNLNGATATFSGLTVGQTYEIQIFANDSRTTRAGAVFAMFSDGVVDLATSFTNGTAGIAELNNSIDDRVSANPVGDASGDSITGSFTATTGIQSFIIGGSNNNFANAAGGFIDQGSPSAFNAIQLRAVAAIPEPTSAALLGLMGLGMVAARRRK